MHSVSPDETLLGLLAAQPQHGYQLLETFHNPDHLGNVWRMSTSQLYAVLKRLEARGWIYGQPLESVNAPPRTHYRLTPAGEARLEAWLHAVNPSPSIRRVRVEFLSRLYIARRLGVPLRPIIETQQRMCQEELARLQRRQAAALPGIGHLAYTLVLAQLEAVLLWLERCEACLSS